MATLYELTGQFLDIYNMDLDDETKQDTLEVSTGMRTTRTR